MDEITETMARVAGEAFDAFEQRERGDETITTLKDDRPQWVFDAVYSSHAGGTASMMFPDDWRYDKTQDAFGAIHDAGEGADLIETGDAFADGAVDIYTHDRLTWLASNLNRPSYVDDARAEGLLSEDADEVERIGLGQYMEAREIWAAVCQAVEDRAEEISEEIELQLPDFLEGYVTAALWVDCLPAEGDPEGESGGREHLTMRDDARESLAEDCRAFIAHNLADLEEYAERRAIDPSQGSVWEYAGHDFWLTRNGHGAGFWDRGLGDLGDRLTEAAKVYGEVLVIDCGDGTADTL